VSIPRESQKEGRTDLVSGLYYSVLAVWSRAGKGPDAGSGTDTPAPAPGPSLG